MYKRQQLWFLDRKEAQRKKDLAAANEARRASPVVIDEGKSDKTELGTRSAVASKWLSGQEQAEAAADEDDVTTATTGGKERRKSVWRDSASEEEQGECAVSVKNEPNAGGMVGDEEVDLNGTTRKSTEPGPTIGLIQLSSFSFSSVDLRVRTRMSTCK